MAKSELEQLKEQLAQLKREFGQLTGHHTTTAEPEVQTDFVPHGSDRHAGMMGLKKAQDHDVPQLDGWALEDVVSYGPTVSTEFLEALLRGKVKELSTPFPTLQSRDPLAPNFAPVMWRPPMSLSQITE